MKKTILIWWILLFWISVNGQKRDREIKLVAAKSGCVLEITFIKNGSNINHIPDFSLRSDTLEGYKILRHELLKESLDTLIIIVSSTKNTDEVNKVEISHQQKNEQEITVRYKEINLKKRLYKL